MCFGGGSDESSRKMVQMQTDEAAQARDKETKRQNRLNEGLANIKAKFHGGKTSTTNYKQGTVGAAGSALPAGYSWAQAPSTTTTTAPKASGNSSSVGGTGSQNLSQRGTGGGRNQPTAQSMGIGPATTTTPGRQYVVGPDGKTYEIGASIEGSDVTTGNETGFGDEFYNKYKQGMLDYYQPQVAEKYGEAKDELTYRLARAGQLRSDVAGTETAKLAGQEEKNTAKVRSDADAAAADLKTRVAKEEQNATNTLYATENPEVAANQATAAMTNLSAEQPDLSPLGAIFDIATIGGANALKGYSNAAGVQQARSMYPTSSRYGATRTV